MTDLLHFDVIVAGGGASGLAAAVSAAREGARVALLENHAFLGGKATAAQVGTVCGFYLRNTEHRIKYASNGISRQFEERLRFKGKSSPQSSTNGLWFLPYHSFDFKRICDEFVTENKIQLFLHTVICDVHIEANKIDSIRAISYDRELNFKAPVYIDCTGEAMLSKLGQVEVFECDEYQASAQVFTLSGVLTDDPATLNLLVMREIKREIESGNLADDFENLSIVPGSIVNNSVSLKIGIPEMVTNKLNKITSLELLSRKRVEILAGFMIRKIAPFKSSYLSHIASETGVRTGRRAIGLSELNETAVLCCKKLPDGVANGSWPIEQWGLGKRVNMSYFAQDDYYHIPAGCLASKKVRNLYFAGRHISATNLAVASSRVIGTCLNTGFASGKLAAGLVNGIELKDTINKIRKEQVDL